MDNAVFQSSIALGAPSNSAMELDYMDELLLEGCWLETTNESSFFHQVPTSGAFFDSPYLWPPTLDTTTEKPSINPLHKSAQEESETTDLAQKSNGQSLVSATCGSIPYEKSFRDGSELNKLFWIEPTVNPTAGSLMDQNTTHTRNRPELNPNRMTRLPGLMNRLIKALSYIKESVKCRETLIQIWVPVNKGGTRVLTTIEQPFSVNSSNPELAVYRNVSVNYQFAAEEDCSMSVGLPGRVFLGEVPEWTPDVRFFRVDEYARVPYAQQCNVRGTFALPVFEQGCRNCLGVIEVVMTTQKVNYRAELESVCRALQAVDLRSSEFSSPQKAKEYNSSLYQAALPEIMEVLKSACGSHGLPLAQTWVPCIQQGRDQGCRHSDENLPHCISTVDSACFVPDPCMQGFHEACSEHHLFKGQGVAGKAFLTNQPCFSCDITTYSKTEYPLSHHGRMFGLCAAVAIRLRSIYTGNADYVLEFFLPTGCRDLEEQKKMLTSLSVIIQRVCRSLRVVTEKEIEQESLISDQKLTIISDDSPQEEELLLNVEVIGSGSSQEVETREGFGGKLLKHHVQDYNLKGSHGSSVDYSTVGEGSCANSGKLGEKRRAKVEKKTITLEVLRQHFAGSLKDAAKSIGVCPTTLKRICRQHGIKRWPSRKIKKVSHSLQKLQAVIDSVQGASPAFQIGSFYSNFPNMSSPNLSATDNPFDHPPPVSPQTAASKSPSSSSSQTSTSSQYCSSGIMQQPFTWNPSGSSKEDLVVGITSSHESVLKRARSEAELHDSSEEATKLEISRSQSQKSLSCTKMGTGTETRMENSNSLKFKDGFGCWDVLKYPNGNVSWTGNDNCLKFLYIKADNDHPPVSKCGGRVIQESDPWRVKVIYGEEKIRFRIPKNWGFKDLVQQVVRRFNIGDMSGFRLKYLDDDSEWVLLTCDADLEECVDICRSSHRETIKLSLQVCHSHSRSSVGSNSHF